jgi:hypothetical protein
MKAEIGVLEQENLEEAAKEGIAFDEVADGTAFGGEFFLDGTDEDASHTIGAG